jgi:hypothetical protein
MKKGGVAKKFHTRKQKNFKGGIIMKKQALAIGCVIAILMIFSVSNVFSWGSATHAYIGNKLGSKGGLKDFDEMYGALAPDVFNYTFTGWYEYIYKQAHYYAFMDMRDAADMRLQKALAFGFVSHNGLWGADFTAHHSGITYGQGKGYVIAKATDLMPIVRYALEQAHITGLPDYVLLEISHNFIEAAVDILMKRVDPKIGMKIVGAALLRTRAFPDMLVEAYAEGLAGYTGMTPKDAASAIRAAEKDFRKITILYGNALSQPEETAVQLLADQFATMAASFLAMMQVSLPDEVDLAPLAAFGIEQGMLLCKDDFAKEVGATVKFVRGNLIQQGITK